MYTRHIYSSLLDLIGPPFFNPARFILTASKKDNEQFHVFLLFEIGHQTLYQKDLGVVSKKTTDAISMARGADTCDLNQPKIQPCSRDYPSLPMFTSKPPDRDNMSFPATPFDV